MAFSLFHAMQPLVVPPYTFFAEIYDDTMSEVPYKRWASFTQNLIKHFAATDEPHALLEIACGSGSFLKEFLRYPQTVGLDVSLPMLGKAAQKIKNPLLCADMRSLPLAAESFDVLINLHDSLNYLQSLENLALHFQEAARVLCKKGLYIFDLSSEYNVMRYYHGQTFVETHHGIDMRWSNNYDSKRRVITSVLQMREDRQCYRETHEQKIFTEEEILQITQKLNLRLLASYGDYKLKKNLSRSQLIVYVFRKI